jgi:hypothetical protein
MPPSSFLNLARGDMFLRSVGIYLQVNGVTSHKTKIDILFYSDAHVTIYPVFYVVI